MFFANIWRDSNWVLFLIMLLPTCLLFCSLLYTGMNRQTGEEYTVSNAMKPHSFLPNPYLISELTIKEKLTLKDMLIKRNTASKQFYCLLLGRIKYSWFEKLWFSHTVFGVSVVSCISICIVGDCNAYIIVWCNLGQLGQGRFSWDWWWFQASMLSPDSSKYCLRVGLSIDLGSLDECKNLPPACISTTLQLF